MESPRKPQKPTCVCVCVCVCVCILLCILSLFEKKVTNPEEDCAVQLHCTKCIFIKIIGVIFIFLQKNKNKKKSKYNIYIINVNIKWWINCKRFVELQLHWKNM